MIWFKFYSLKSQCFENVENKLNEERLLFDSIADQK